MKEPFNFTNSPKQTLSKPLTSMSSDNYLQVENSKISWRKARLHLLGDAVKKKDPRVKHEDDNDIFDRPMTKKIGSPL